MNYTASCVKSNVPYYTADGCVLTIITRMLSQEKFFLPNKPVPVILTPGTSFLSSQPEAKLEI